MTTPQSLLDPKSLQRIVGLELVARQIVEGTLTGLHRSQFHGYSVDFLQHRPYVPGDDLRRLDWKVLGKTDKYFVRQYEDETNLNATLLLDASGSMEYASAEISKIHYAVRFAAALAYLLIGQQDSVGLTIFDQVERKHFPPRSGKRQLNLIIEELESVKPGGKTSLASVFHDLVHKLPRRGLILLVTDAFDEVPQILNALAHLRSAHHEVILFQILDRQEMEFGFDNWVRFDCLELEDRKVMIDPAQIRQAYLKRFKEFEAELREGCRRHNVDFVPVVTDNPYDESLASYITLRGASR